MKTVYAEDLMLALKGFDEQITCPRFTVKITPFSVSARICDFLQQKKDHQKDALEENHAIPRRFLLNAWCVPDWRTNSLPYCKVVGSQMKDILCDSCDQ